MRAGGAVRRLLLVLALTSGVFLMHTLGHLGDSHGAPRGHAPAMASGATATDAMASGAMAVPAMAVRAMAVPAVDVPVMSDPLSGPSSGHGSGLAMDMASLCLAVLMGAWVLAALLWAVRSRRPYGMAGLLARVAVVRRSTAPPRRPDLAQLSVLRL